MITTFSEQEMVIKFCKFLEKKGKVFAVEVPFFSRSIDLVFTDTSGKYYAVEFKLKNWKKAIAQAKYYMLGADFSLVCIPANIYNEQVEKEVLDSNCGLILFDVESEEFKIVKQVEQVTNKGRFLMEKGFTYACDNNNYQYLLSLNYIS
ncbi:MAG TPA: hypothetical protein VMZ91_05635 [Candidatus Paceibacterota bacterium]|nr:hypothetical protein [Candidatus Paceibacterota bacterium]